MSLSPEIHKQTQPAGQPAALRFVWHFGFQKTGTTFLQAILWRNRNLLAQDAAIFNCRDGDWAFRNAANAFCETPGADTERAVIDAAKRLRDTAVSTGRMSALVTDENVLGYRLYDDAGDVFSRSERLIPLIERAMDGCQPEFVFYTRDMPCWLASAYNQEVKQMRAAETFDAWLKKIPFEQDWDLQLQRLRKVSSGAVVFRDMTQDQQERRLLGAYILDRAGIDPDSHAALKMPRGRNQSLSPAALEFMRQINATRIPDRQLVHVRRTVLANPQLFAGKEGMK